MLLHQLHFISWNDRASNFEHLLRQAAKVPSDMISADHDALVALYYSTDGANWLRSENWNTDADLSLWHGVEVVEGRVVTVFLPNNNLRGCIPREIGNLDALQRLSLGRNQLTGALPKELGALRELKELVLFKNQLTGSIPEELGALSELMKLVLFDNLLTGTIPEGLASLSKLEELVLGINYLSGPIPEELGALIKLNTLDLSRNKIFGCIPGMLGKLAGLTHLYLDGNLLSGPIPPEIGALSNLKVLHLQDNQLTGHIPPELGDLAALQELSLRRNQLSGTIPKQLGNLTGLSLLNLSDNGLTGSIPPELRDIEELKGLFVEGNRLKGKMPRSERERHSSADYQLSFSTDGAPVPICKSAWSLLIPLYLGYLDLGTDVVTLISYYPDRMIWFTLGLVFVVGPALITAIFSLAKEDMWTRVSVALHLGLLREALPSLREGAYTKVLVTLRVMQPLYESIPQLMLQTYALLRWNSHGFPSIYFRLFSIAISWFSLAYATTGWVAEFPLSIISSASLPSNGLTGWAFGTTPADVVVSGLYSQNFVWTFLLYQALEIGARFVSLALLASVVPDYFFLVLGWLWISRRIVNLRASPGPGFATSRFHSQLRLVGAPFMDSVMDDKVSYDVGCALTTAECLVCLVLSSEVLMDEQAVAYGVTRRWWHIAASLLMAGKLCLGLLIVRPFKVKLGVGFGGEQQQRPTPDSKDRDVEEGGRSFGAAVTDKSVVGVTVSPESVGEGKVECSPAPSEAMDLQPPKRPKRVRTANGFILQLVDQTAPELSSDRRGLWNCSCRSGADSISQTNFIRFAAMTREQMDVSKSLEARVRNAEERLFKMRGATDSEILLYDDKDRPQGTALTLAGDLSKMKHMESGRAAIRERIAMKRHTLEPLVPTVAIVAALMGHRHGTSKSSLSWRSSPVYSWRVIRYILARCEDELASVMVTIGACLLLQWGSVAAACVAASVINKSPMRSVTADRTQRLIDRCRELLEKMMKAPPVAVEGLMVLLAETVLQERIGPKTSEVRCYAPHLNSMFPWLMDADSAVPLETKLPKARPIMWEAVCAVSACGFPVNATAALKEGGGAKFRLRIGIGEGTLSMDAERFMTASKRRAEQKADPTGMSSTIVYHMTKLAYEANSSAAWWSQRVKDDLIFLGEVVVGAGFKKGPRPQSYPGSRFRPEASGVLDSMRSMLGGTLNVCGEVLKDADGLIAAGTNVAGIFVRALQHGIAPRNPDLDGAGQALSTDYVEDLFAQDPIDCRKLFLGRGEYGGVGAWDEGKAMAFWIVEGSRTLCLIGRLKKKSRLDENSAIAHGFALTLLKLFFRTPTLPGSLLATCLADMVAKCDIDPISNTDKLPRVDDLPAEVLERMTGLTSAGSPEEQRNLLGCVGVTFMIVGTIRRWITTEPINKLEGYNYAPGFARKTKITKQEDMMYLPIGCGLAHLTSRKVKLFDGLLLEADTSPLGLDRFKENAPETTLGLVCTDGFFLQMKLRYRRGKKLKTGAALGYVEDVEAILGSKKDMSRPPADLIKTEEGMEKVRIPSGWG